MSFNRSLGFRLDAEADAIVLDPKPEHEVVPGTIHFAVLATLAEVSAAHAAGASVVPTHVSLQLLKRATPHGQLEARGRVLRSGRTLVFAEGEVSQHGELVAKVTVTFARVG
jgi:acyl-coenzyme A thioesterase PaaI-like protein